MLVRNEAGDTLVEVLIATAILGLAVVGAMAAMTFGQGIALSSVERTEVQGLMNSQLSYMRYARDIVAQGGTSSLWTDMASRAQPDTTPVSSTLCNGTRPYYSAGMFYIQEFNGATPPSIIDYPTTSPAVAKAATAAASPGDGMWIEARRGGAVGTEFIDFYVKSCWSGVGDGPMQEARTVMRLYVPS